MGYYTYYTFSMEGDRPGDKERVVEFLKGRDSGVVDFVFDEDLETSDMAKWYEEEEDMRALSREFPHILFHIHGDGEDSEDLWEAHYLGGKRQLCYAVIPPFDPAQLS